jgi:hypothetical protein
VRRNAWSLLVVLALVAGLAGCGGSSKSSSGGGDARAEALSYLPKGSPAVVEITTDANSAQVKAALDLVNRFPGASLLLGQLTDQIGKGTSLDYDKDVKPALGNPAVFSLIPSGGGQFVGAMVAKDAGKAKLLVTTGSTKVGARAGFTVYRDNGDSTSFSAFNGATVLLADNRANLDAAIDRHEKGAGAKPGDESDLMTGLPGDALVKVYGLVAPLIAKDPGAASARRVPFVNALKGYGVAVTAAKDGVTAAFRVDTSNADLPADEQPLASGAQPAATAAVGPIDVGVRDVAHTLAFAERVGQHLAPGGYQQFIAGLNVIKAQTGVDVNRDFLGQLGDAAIATDTKLFAVRVKAKDPNALRTAITSLRPIIPAFLEGAGLPGLRLGAGTGGLTLLGRGRHYVAAYGVIGDQLVIGTASPARLTAFARRPTSAEKGTAGAAAVRGTTAQLVRLIYGAVSPQPLPDVAGLFLSRLGNLVGSATENAKAITGKLTLPVK